MGNPPDLTSLSQAELIALVRQLLEQIQTQREEIEQLRRGQRSVAPLSKGAGKTNPKRPGRKPGQGPFLRRAAPPEELAGETVEAAAPAACPHCGGRLEQERIEEASLTDAAPQPRPVVRRFRVAVCRCQECGRRVRGQAPGLAAGQHGATAHRLGPNLKASAHALHYGVGVPVRKVPAVLEQLTGVRVTQSALTQHALRQAGSGVGQAYACLRASLRKAAVVYTDDTGWRVGGRPAHLMTFDTDQATVYQIRPQHRNEEVRELVPSSYAGVLVTDRGKSYEARELDSVAQQKCLAHALRNISQALEGKRGRARAFGQKLKKSLAAALALWRDYQSGQLSPDEWRKRGGELDQDITRQLRNRVLKDEDNQRLLNGLGWQQDRGRLLLFLRQPEVEPTNNRAERALRPAIIARKVSQCSKTERGAHAYAAFKSLAQTALKQGALSVAATLRPLFSATNLPAIASP
jgi:transposase